MKIRILQAPMHSTSEDFCAMHGVRNPDAGSGLHDHRQKQRQSRGYDGRPCMDGSQGGRSFGSAACRFVLTVHF